MLIGRAFQKRAPCPVLKGMGVRFSYALERLILHFGLYPGVIARLLNIQAQP